MMARDRYRIFDSDTHVGPDAQILAGYLSQSEKERLAAWEPYRPVAIACLRGASGLQGFPG